MNVFIHKSTGMHARSLVIANSEDAASLSDRISQVTSEHEVQTCRLEDAFDVINAQNYALIWLIMQVPVGQDVLSLTTSIRYDDSPHTVDMDTMYMVAIIM